MQSNQQGDFVLCINMIVDKINDLIGQDPDAKNIIGVLDIYGFESFKINRFAISTTTSRCCKFDYPLLSIATCF